MATILKNIYSSGEWAAALADLGTFVPFLLVYLMVPTLDPAGVFFSFGATLIVTGLFFRAPIPVQPMKAIGASVANIPNIQTQTIAGASLATGLLWFILGQTGLIRKITSFIPRSIGTGISVGVGFSLGIQASKLIGADLLPAICLPIIAYALFRWLRAPFVPSLLVITVLYMYGVHPSSVEHIFSVPLAFSLPHLSILDITWKDFLLGAFVLALPQFPMTFGNAIVSVTRENNRLYPDRPVTETSIAKSTGIMNLFGSVFGGIPMCHGSSGTVSYAAFGAKTGGATVILGSILLILALFLAPQTSLFLASFPKGVSGALLLIASFYLVMGGKNMYTRESEAGFATFALTTLLSCWNPGIGLIGGLIHAYVFGEKTKEKS